MAFNADLAARVRSVLVETPDVTERQMFGGLAFMVAGRMACGVSKDELMVRVGAADYQAALEKPGVRPMDFTGRPMTGMVFVGTAGYKDEEQLRAWVENACRIASTLPPREVQRRTRPKRGFRG